MVLSENNIFQEQITLKNLQLLAKSKLSTIHSLRNLLNSSII